MQRREKGHCLEADGTWEASTVPGKAHYAEVGFVASDEMRIAVQLWVWDKPSM
jgi:hypothetical protein